MILERVRAGSSPKEIAAAEKRAIARRRAFEAFMVDRGMTAAGWARDAGVSSNIIYNFLNGHSRGLAQGTLEKLARAASASIAEIMGESASVGASAAVLEARVHACSGQWRKSYEVGGRGSRLAVPPGIIIDEAVVVKDQHVNHSYRPGSIIGIQNIGTLGRRGLLDGDRVLVHRMRGAEHEVTIRQVQVANGSKSAELIFATDDRRFGSRILIDPWPYTGAYWEVDGDRFQIRGRAVLGVLVDD